MRVHEPHCSFDLVHDGQLTWALGALAVPYLGGKEVTAYEFTGL